MKSKGTVRFQFRIAHLLLLVNLVAAVLWLARLDLFAFVFLGILCTVAAAGPILFIACLGMASDLPIDRDVKQEKSLQFEEIARTEPL